MRITQQSYITARLAHRSYCAFKADQLGNSAKNWEACLTEDSRRRSEGRTLPSSFRRRRRKGLLPVLQMRGRGTGRGPLRRRRRNDDYYGLVRPQFAASSPSWRACVAREERKIEYLSSFSEYTFSFFFKIHPSLFTNCHLFCLKLGKWLGSNKIKNVFYSTTMQSWQDPSLEFISPLHPTWNFDAKILLSNRKYDIC